MKILVTGNLGYVGPSVVGVLRRAHPNATVHGLDAGYFAHCLTGVAAPPERVLDAQLYADVRTVGPDALEGVDAVVHLAGISNDPIGNRFEDLTLDVNHGGTIRLARMAKEAGARAFVFASSCSVYGQADDTPTDESCEIGPLTAYARSKALSERDLEALADDAFTVTCLRFATACGWSDRLRLDLVLNDFVAGAIASGRIEILSDGTPWRPLIHVRDMARAIEWAVARPAQPGGDFLAVNAGSDGWNYQVRELADAVARVVPETTVSVNPDALPDKRSYRVSFALFRRLAPEHQPRVGLDEAVSELADGLTRMGFRDPDFRRSRLVRLRALDDLTASGVLGPDLTWVG